MLTPLGQKPSVPPLRSSNLTLFDKDRLQPYYFEAMKARRRLIFYFSLFAIVLVIGLVCAQETKKEESEKPIEMTERSTTPINIEITTPTTITAAITAKKSTQIYSGVIVTGKGDNLLVLINKNIRLPETYEPSDLVSIDGLAETTHKGMLLRVEAARALESMVKAAKREGANLIVLSAHRSYWSQQATFSSWAANAGLTAAETFSARPGHSQHQLGTAVDFTAESVNLGLTKSFDESKEGLWLVNNASKFGFVLSYPEGKETITGYTYEPWHWRYIGVENAKNMTNSGLILEEYLQKFGVI